MDKIIITAPSSTHNFRISAVKEEENQQDKQFITQGLQNINDMKSNQQNTFISSVPVSTETAVTLQNIVPANNNIRITNNDNNGFIRKFTGQKLCRYFIRKWPIISELLAILFVILLIWILGYSLLPKYFQIDSSIINIGILFVGAEITGILMQLIRLPDILGMLFFGILFTNINTTAFKDPLSHSIQGFLRQVALVNIMLLVGLGLDYKAIKKFFRIIMYVTIIPAIAELSIIAVLANIVFSFPYPWGILLGLVITAVSPNVIVSVMLELQKKKLGVERGIHTIVYGMTATCDILAILLFRILLNIILSTESTQHLVTMNAAGIGIGIFYGLAYGFFLIYFPYQNSEYANAFRFLLIILGGIVVVVGTEVIDCPSGGVLGCTILAFIAGEGWRRRKMNGKDKKTNFTSEYLQLLWSFFKPISFSLIGIEVNFSRIDTEIFGYGILIIILGILFRLSFSYVSMYGKYLRWQERAYITVCGLPKATIQAALGPLVLDILRDKTIEPNDEYEKYHNNTIYEKYAKIILVTSVLAIIFTAPLGAILMIKLAPKWLKNDSDDNGEGGGLNQLSSTQQSIDTISTVPTITETIKCDNQIYINQQTQL